MSAPEYGRKHTDGSRSGGQPPESTREAAMVTIKDGAWCDPEIVDLVTALNTGDLATVASCSGHGHRPGVISLKDGRQLMVFDSLDHMESAQRAYPVDINGEPTRASLRTQPSDSVVEAVNRLQRYQAIGKGTAIDLNGPFLEDLETICTAALAAQPRDDVRERWSWGYSDGTPGTPEYEPPRRICNWCRTVEPRCQCDTALAPTTQGTDSGLAGEVTQADRQAAVDVLDTLLQATDPEMISPEQAETLIQEAFARHRTGTDRKAVLEEERAAIVAWLEAEAEERGKKTQDGWALHWAADRIAANEHRALAEGAGK